MAWGSLDNWRESSDTAASGIPLLVLLILGLFLGKTILAKAVALCTIPIVMTTLDHVTREAPMKIPLRGIHKVHVEGGLIS